MAVSLFEENLQGRDIHHSTRRGRFSLVQNHQLCALIGGPGPLILGKKETYFVSLGALLEKSSEKGEILSK